MFGIGNRPQRLATQILSRYGHGRGSSAKDRADNLIQMAMEDGLLLPGDLSGSAYHNLVEALTGTRPRRR